MIEFVYPLLTPVNLLSHLVECHETTKSVGDFLADVSALAARLPEASHVMNLCTGRYRFAVAFAAALQRQQLTLLPTAEAPGSLATLTARYQGAYVLHDGAVTISGEYVSFPFPSNLAGDPPSSIPVFAADQPAVVLFTSGSTGTPEPYARSWGALVHSTRAAGKALGLADLSSCSVFGTVPHQHSYGLESILMLAFQHGFTFSDSRSLLPADIVMDMVKLPEPRVLVTTPAHLRSLVAYRGVLPQLHSIICATAALDTCLAEVAEQQFGAPLYEIYGCSEIGQIATRRTVKTEEWTCLEGIKLQEQDGEIWASGASAGANAPLNDIVELREPTRFLLHGRKSDLVNIAGKRSSLSYLDFHLHRVPGVVDGIFLPSQDENNRLTAYVVAPTLTAQTLRTALSQQVDSAFLPRPIHFVDALPRNAAGKLTRSALEQLDNAVHPN